MSSNIFIHDLMANFHVATAICFLLIIDTYSAAGTESTNVTVTEAASLMTRCLLGVSTGASCDEITVGDVTYQPTVPELLRFEVFPVQQHEGVPLAIQPKIRAYDSSGAVITHLGILELPWQMTVSLRPGTGHGGGRLTGSTTLAASGGWFNFTDLCVSHAGSGYVLDFVISDPADSNLTLHVVLDINPLPMATGVHSMTSADIQQGSTFAINFELRDNSTDNAISDISWRGHVFAVICGEVIYTGNLNGTLTNTFNMTSGRAEFDDWSYHGYGFIYITCRVVSFPMEYDIYSFHQLVILSPDQMTIPTERTESVKIRYKMDYHSTLPTTAAAIQLHQATLHRLSSDQVSIVVRTSTIEPGSILITFMIEGGSENVTNALVTLCNNIAGGYDVTVGGASLTLDSYMAVDGIDYYTSCEKSADDNSGLHPGYIALIVVLCLLLLAAIVLLVIWIICVKPKKKIHDDDLTRTGCRSVAESSSTVDNRFQESQYADGFYYIENGRTIFLAGAAHKMPGMYAPMNTTMEKKKEPTRPLKYMKHGCISREPTLVSRENTWFRRESTLIHRDNTDSWLHREPSFIRKEKI